MPFEPIIEELKYDLAAREVKLPRVRTLGRELFAELRAAAGPVATEVRHNCCQLQHLGELSSLTDVLMVTVTRFDHYARHVPEQCEVCAEFPGDLPSKARRAVGVLRGMAASARREAQSPNPELHMTPASGSFSLLHAHRAADAGERIVRPPEETVRGELSRLRWVYLPAAVILPFAVEECFNVVTREYIPAPAWADSIG